MYLAIASITFWLLSVLLIIFPFLKIALKYTLEYNSFLNDTVLGDFIESIHDSNKDIEISIVLGLSYLIYLIIGFCIVLILSFAWPIIIMTTIFSIIIYKSKKK